MGKAPARLDFDKLDAGFLLPAEAQRVYPRDVDRMFISLVVPDFIANPGGIIAAYIELTSKSDNKVQEAKDFTIAKITDNVGKLMALCDQFGVEPVHAGQYLALSNIFYGIKN